MQEISSMCDNIITLPSKQDEDTNKRVGIVPNTTTTEERASRKVSFELETQLSLLKPDVSSYSSFAISGLFKEDTRVVSNETIHSSTVNLKNKSKSLTSLTRSGDLQSLLEESSYLLSVPTVSEESLLSYELDSEEMILNSSEQSIITNSPCSGWGQYVDFMSIEHHKSPRSKKCSPARRRKSSISTASSSYRRHHNIKQQHLLGGRSRRRLLIASASTPKICNNNKYSISTNEIVDAFRIQLSLDK